MPGKKYLDELPFRGRALKFRGKLRRFKKLRFGGFFSEEGVFLDGLKIADTAKYLRVDNEGGRVEAIEVVGGVVVFNGRIDNLMVIGECFIEKMNGNVQVFGNLSAETIAGDVKAETVTSLGIYNNVTAKKVEVSYVEGDVNAETIIEQNYNTNKPKYISHIQHDVNKIAAFLNSTCKFLKGRSWRQWFMNLSYEIHLRGSEFDINKHIEPGWEEVLDNQLSHHFGQFLSIHKDSEKLPDGVRCSKKLNSNYRDPLMRDILRYLYFT